MAIRYFFNELEGGFEGSILIGDTGLNRDGLGHQHLWVEDQLADYSAFYFSLVQ